jgi:hypothetical protein
MAGKRFIRPEGGLSRPAQSGFTKKSEGALESSLADVLG